MVTEEEEEKSEFIESVIAYKTASFYYGCSVAIPNFA